MHFPIYAQYSSFDILPFSGSGFSGIGIGVNDKTTFPVYNFAHIPSNSFHLELGLTQSFYKSSEFPLLFTPINFLYKIENSQGVGIYWNSPFRSLKNSETRLLHYSGNLFYSLNWKEIFISFGLGPRISWRGQELSKWSLGGFVGLSYTKENWSFGIFYQSSGSFHYKNYRESDELKEKLPDFVYFGFSRNFLKSYLLYLEVGRILYENSKFYLNDRNEKPNLERGIGADIEPSLGLEYTLDESFKFRLGLALVGEYDENGKNRRGGRVSFGNLFFPFTNETFYLKWSYVNHSIFSKSGGYTPENSFSISIGYIW